MEAWIFPTMPGTGNTIDRIIDKGLARQYMFGIGFGNGDHFATSSATRTVTAASR